jgi:NAD(P)-dependent dehydrogenase (short-subunit alcohol dehydrogenase family)
MTPDWQSYHPAPDALEGRIVLVTGATQGIGRALAFALARHGATVLAHGRKAPALEKLHAELSALGRAEPAVAQLDFERAQGSDYQTLLTEIETRYGRLDGLVHNAAILGDLSPIEHYDIGLWQRVLHVNLNAPFILTRCLLPVLRQSSDASIVFTTSAVGHKGRAYWGAYAVSKFGVEGLTETLADELANTPIRVNMVNPGATRTNMRARAYPAEDSQTLVPPEDVVLPYLYLLGAASRGVSGQRIDAQPNRR